MNTLAHVLLRLSGTTLLACGVALAILASHMQPMAGLRWLNVSAALIACGGITLLAGLWGAWAAATNRSSSRAADLK